MPQVWWSVSEGVQRRVALLKEHAERQCRGGDYDAEELVMVRAVGDDDMMGSSGQRRKACG